MLCTVGEPTNTFVLSFSQLESSAHLKWFVMRMMVDDYTLPLSERDQKICEIDIAIAELFVMKSDIDREKGADIHLVQSSIMQVREFLYQVIMGCEVVPPLRMHRYYDYEGGNFRHIASVLLTRGSVTDPNDEQLYPLLLDSETKLVQFFCLIKLLGNFDSPDFE